MSQIGLISDMPQIWTSASEQIAALAVGGEAPIGALGLNCLRTERDWPDTLVKRLQLVAQVFTNALARGRHEQRLLQSQARQAASAELAGLAFYDPSILNFVLVDYKGGGALKPFEHLPHCVDIVTNLNKAAVQRMFVSINAEIRRRQELNARTGTKDIVDYH